MRSVLYSPRGLPLVWGGGPRPPGGAVLTIECYSKWYEMFLVFADRIVSVDFGVLEDHCKNESPYCDHAPNPKAVYRYAAANGHILDDTAYEMMIGRWELEYRNNYDVERDDEQLAAGSTVPIATEGDA